LDDAVAVQRQYGLDFEYPRFVHTVLVDMRARLARSDRPNRIFEVVLDEPARE
jgi:hypothetical protein